MDSKELNYTLSVVTIKEGKRYVAFSPALDLSTSGKTAQQARHRFTEAAELFFEEIIGRGTFTRALQELGWSKVKNSWQPPMVISQQHQRVSVPVG